MKISRNKLRIHRKRRIKAKIRGTKELPRLAVFKSLSGIYAQVIDDEKGMTLISVTSKELKIKNDIKSAEKIGEAIAKKCLNKKIDKIVFDRSGYKYHGKIKALADGARKGGLKF